MLRQGEALSIEKVCSILALKGRDINAVTYLALSGLGKISDSITQGFTLRCLIDHPFRAL